MRNGAPGAALADAVVAKLKLDVAPDRVRLLREVEGGAPVPLDSCEKLAAQGVGEGSKVLVVVEVMAPAVPARDAEPESLRAAVRAIANDLSLLTSAVRRSRSSVSFSQLAHDTLSELSDFGRVDTAVPEHGAPAILGAAEQQELLRLSEAQGEKSVVKFLTPRLAGLLPAPAAGGLALALVNSENFPWLERTGAAGLALHRAKPDLFLSWLPFVELREGGKGQGKGGAYLYGTLAGHALQRAGCVAVLFEGKKGLLARPHFGELVAHHKGIPGHCRGLVFGATEFWMYESKNGAPRRLRKDAWAAGGSAERLRKFIRAAPAPPLAALLQRLLSDLGVAVHHVRPAAQGLGGARCFLGAGASGHV